MSPCVFSCKKTDLTVLLWNHWTAVGQSPLVRRATAFSPRFPRNSISPLPSPLLNPLLRRLLHPIAESFLPFKVSAMSTSVDGSDSDTSCAVFALSPTSILKIQKGDITRWSVDGSCDAIVNAANQGMLGGGGVDGAIHRAAGRELREACYKVPEVYPGVRCPTGEARITRGFRLPASHVIHTAGPIYDEDEHPEALLESSYRNSLLVAKENNIQFVAFPAISCGVFGYPYNEAASVAIPTIKQFSDDIKEVHFVLFSDDIYDTWLEKAKEILGEGLPKKVTDEETSKHIEGEEAQ